MWEAYLILRSVDRRPLRVAGPYNGYDTGKYDPSEEGGFDSIGHESKGSSSCWRSRLKVRGLRLHSNQFQRVEQIPAPRYHTSRKSVEWRLESVASVKRALRTRHRTVEVDQISSIQLRSPCQLQWHFSPLSPVVSPTLYKEFKQTPSEHVLGEIGFIVES